MSKKAAPFVEDTTSRKKYNSKFEYAVKTYWRPFMAWQYFFVCIFDFILGPIGHSIMYGMGFLTGTYVAWESITLQGGGLYHISMGAIVGVTAWTRGMEQIKYGDSSYPTYDSDTQEIPDSSYDPAAFDDRDPVQEAEDRMRS